MNLEKYTAYFHDGTLIDIQYTENEILISMSSAEMSEEDLLEEIALSEDNMLKGILHLEDVKFIFVDDEPFYGKLQLLADSGKILDFYLFEKKVRFFISWENYPPHKKIEKYSDIIIECKRIYWENIPDLFEPFY